MNGFDVTAIMSRMTRRLSGETGPDYRCLGCGHGYNTEDRPYTRDGSTRCPKCGCSRYRWAQFERGIR